MVVCSADSTRRRFVNVRSVNVGSINVGSINVRSFNVRSFNVNSFSVARCSTESSVPRTEYAGRFMTGQVFAAALMKLERTRNIDRQFRHRQTDSVTNASINLPNPESKSVLHDCVDKHRLSRTVQGE